MSEHSYVSDGVHWRSTTDGSIAPWSKTEADESYRHPFEFRGPHIHATEAVRHQRSGETFRTGARLATLGRDRNGRHQIVLNDGSVRKL